MKEEKNTCESPRGAKSPEKDQYLIEFLLGKIPKDKIKEIDKIIEENPDYFAHMFGNKNYRLIAKRNRILLLCPMPLLKLQMQLREVSPNVPNLEQPHQQLEV